MPYAFYRVVVISGDIYELFHRAVNQWSAGSAQLTSNLRRGDGKKVKWHKRQSQKSNGVQSPCSGKTFHVSS